MLLHPPLPPHVILHLDSQYVLDLLLGLSLPSCNLELAILLLDYYHYLSSRTRVEIRKVESHTGIPGNDRAVPIKDSPLTLLFIFPPPDLPGRGIPDFFKGGGGFFFNKAGGGGGGLLLQGGGGGLLQGGGGFFFREGGGLLQGGGLLLQGGGGGTSSRGGASSLGRGASVKGGVLLQRGGSSRSRLYYSRR